MELHFFLLRMSSPVPGYSRSIGENPQRQRARSAQYRKIDELHHTYSLIDQKLETRRLDWGKASSGEYSAERDVFGGESGRRRWRPSSNRLIASSHCARVWGLPMYEYIDRRFYLRYDRLRSNPTCRRAAHHRMQKEIQSVLTVPLIVLISPEYICVLATHATLD